MDVEGSERSKTVDDYTLEGATSQTTHRQYAKNKNKKKVHKEGGHFIPPAASSQLRSPMASLNPQAQQMGMTQNMASLMAQGNTEVGESRSVFGAMAEGFQKMAETMNPATMGSGRIDPKKLAAQRGVEYTIADVEKEANSGKVHKHQKSSGYSKHGRRYSEDYDRGQFSCVHLVAGVITCILFAYLFLGCIYTRQSGESPVHSFQRFHAQKTENAAHQAVAVKNSIKSSMGMQTETDGEQKIKKVIWSLLTCACLAAAAASCVMCIETECRRRDDAAQLQSQSRRIAAVERRQAARSGTRLQQIPLDNEG